MEPPMIPRPLNHPATMANLVNLQFEILKTPGNHLTKEDFVKYMDAQRCIDAIKAGYTDDLILTALQFVGPGIAVQS